eukprot:IDg5376t1
MPVPGPDCILIRPRCPTMFNGCRTECLRLRRPGTLSGLSTNESTFESPEDSAPIRAAPSPLSRRRVRRERAQRVQLPVAPSPTPAPVAPTPAPAPVPIAAAQAVAPQSQPVFASTPSPSPGCRLIRPSCRNLTTPASPTVAATSFVSLETNSECVCANVPYYPR